MRFRIYNLISRDVILMSLGIQGFRVHYHDAPPHLQSENGSLRYEL